MAHFFGIEERYWYWLALSSHRKGFIEADLHLDKYCLVLPGWELDKEMVVHACTIFLPCAVQGMGDTPTLHFTVIIHQYPSVCCTTKLGKQISRLDLYHMFTNILLLLWYRAWETHQLYTSCHYSPTPLPLLHYEARERRWAGLTFFFSQSYVHKLPVVALLQWLIGLTVDIVYWHFSCCVKWLTSLTVDILHWHPLLCCPELKRLTNLTVYIVRWHPLCYRAKESQQLDSSHCSLTPTVLQS